METCLGGKAVTKKEATKEAVMKAALSRQDQVVFKNIRHAIEEYDYTSAKAWFCRRRVTLPAATFVTDVKYDEKPTGESKSLKKVK